MQSLAPAGPRPTRSSPSMQPKVTPLCTAPAETCHCSPYSARLIQPTFLLSLRIPTEMFYPFSIRYMRATCTAHLTHPHVLITPLIFHCSFSLSLTGLWTTGEKKARFGYDYWYQPFWDVMISTEWGAPKSFKKGFSLPDTQDEGSAQDSKHIRTSGSQQFVIIM